MAKNYSDWEKAIRHELIERNMDMKSLAKALDINTSYLYDIINDNRKATEMRQKINDFLGLDGE